MTEETGELRMFTFGHFMLSSIQQGIQAAHAITNMFTFYVRPDEDVNTHSPEATMLYSWANQHETIVCKNGGDTDALEELLTMFNQEENPFPYHEFNESDGALCGSITCIAIVIPERIFKDGVAIMRNRNSQYKYLDGEHHYSLPSVGEDAVYTYTEFEHELIKLIRNTRHAQ